MLNSIDRITRFRLHFFTNREKSEIKMMMKYNCINLYEIIRIFNHVLKYFLTEDKTAHRAQKNSKFRFCFTLQSSF